MSSDKAKAAELKAKGNAAFSAGRFLDSITFFTEAIAADPSDHIFYSNRSGAYASLQRNEEALKDAEKCIELAPSFIKGYSRKGLALFQLKRFDEAKEIYELALESEPNNAQIKEALKDVERAINANANRGEDPMGKMFGEDMWVKLQNDPVTKVHMKDPNFVAKMKMIQKQPSLFGSMISDPQVGQAIGVIFGLGPNSFTAMGKKEWGKNGDDDGMVDDDDEDDDDDTAKAGSTASRPASKPSPASSSSSFSKPSYSSPPTKAASESDKLREDGNTAFKAKKFDEAIAAYEKAAALDPKSMVYANNIAACHFERKDYAATIASSKRALEIGRENMGSYKDVAKAYTRIGNAHMALKEYDEAIAAYQSAQVEEYTDKTKELMKKAQQMKDKLNAAAYIDEAKSEEEKLAGNQLFAQGKWVDAIAKYTEALKRNPANYKVLSNRAACYSKLMDWQRGLDDCEACLKADPKFVKAYIRKGKIEHFLKQYHKALETFERGLALEPTSSELIEAKRATVAAINMGESDPEARKARAQEAMKDPEIQNIMRDPIISKVLQDMQDNPEAGRAAMRDKDIRAKLEKLVAAGVLSTS